MQEIISVWRNPLFKIYVFSLPIIRSLLVPDWNWLFELLLNSLGNQNLSFGITFKIKTWNLMSFCHLVFYMIHISWQKLLVWVVQRNEIPRIDNLLLLLLKGDLEFVASKLLNQWLYLIVGLEHILLSSLQREHLSRIFIPCLRNIWKRQSLSIQGAFILWWRWPVVHLRSWRPSLV